MSLRVTENTYNLVIEHVIKEITEDPQMNHISSEALDYLKKTWSAKLLESGVYTPANDFPRNLVNANAVPIRPMMNEASNYYGNMMAQNTAEAQAQMARYLQQHHAAARAAATGQYTHGEYMHDAPVWLPQHGYPNMNMYQYGMQGMPGMPGMQYNAKASLPQGQTAMAPAMLQQSPNLSQSTNQTDKNKVNQQQATAKEIPKNVISVKTEAGEEGDTSRVQQPVKPAANHEDKTNGAKPSDADAAAANEKDKAAKPANHEEEEEKEEQKVDDDDEDVAELFEYDITDKAGVTNLKEEHIPPPIQQGNAAGVTTNMSVHDLNPYDPEERPLDSDDDPDYGENAEATDQLLAFHEKVHRHGSKWKVNLKQGILNSKGKEYILSQITGDFDF